MISFTNTLDPSGNWGVLPVNGGTFENGSFEGVFGGLVDNEYDMSITDWLATPERTLRVDFILMERATRVLAMTPQAPPVCQGCQSVN